MSKFTSLASSSWVAPKKLIFCKNFGMYPPLWCSSSSVQYRVAIYVPAAAAVDTSVYPALTFSFARSFGWIDPLGLETFNFYVSTFFWSPKAVRVSLVASGTCLSCWPWWPSGITFRYLVLPQITVVVACFLMRPPTFARWHFLVKPIDLCWNDAAGGGWPW